MSVEGIIGFLKALRDDSVLRGAVEAASRGKEREEAAEAMAEIGARKGYVFTAEEALIARAALLSTRGRELNEGDLASVAGGGSWDQKLKQYADIASELSGYMGELGSATKNLFSAW